MSVASKVVQIMQSIGAIKDDAQNTYQGFSYASADMILTVARSHMANVGLACIPAMTNITMTDSVYLISYEFTLVDVDDPEHYMVQHWAQSIPIESKSNKGNYLDDKAIGKATTYAHKYFLMKLFLISDKDDVDIDGSDSNQYEKQDKPSPPKQQKSAQKPATASPTSIQDIRTAIHIDPAVKTRYKNNNQHIAGALSQVLDAYDGDSPSFEYIRNMMLTRDMKSQAKS